MRLGKPGKDVSQPSVKFILFINNKITCDENEINRHEIHCLVAGWFWICNPSTSTSQVDGITDL